LVAFAITLCFAVLGLCPLLLAADQLREDPSAAAEVQDVVFFSEARPILFRLHLVADGKPFAARWEAFLGKLFAALDRDGDGVLDKDEAARAPLPQQLQQVFQGNVFLPNLTRPPAFPEGLKNEDGAVTVTGFLEFYRRFGAGPVQLQAAPLRSATGDPLMEALFNALDANRDGKLSGKELAGASQSLLAQLDDNDDEILTAQELSVQTLPRQQVQQLFQLRQQLPQGAQPRRSGTPRSPLLLVAKEGPDSKLEQRLQIAREVVQRYDRDSNLTVSRDEIGLPGELFVRLDANQNGELDAVELLRWLVVLPDVEVTLRLGKTADREPLAELFPRDDKSADSNLRKLADNTVLFTTDEAQVSVVRRAPGLVPNNAGNTRLVLLRQFRTADKNDKGYLTLSDVDPPQQRNLKLLFAVADRDGDGKLTEMELNAWFDLLADGAGCLTTVALVENGRGLFTLLDADKDGRLSVRELRNAWSRLAEFDRDESGAVGRDQLPLQYQVQVGQGAFNNAVQLGVSAPAPGQRGPLWFRKMDANGDNDVSLREFLGSIEDFRRIDTDSDGLISPEEAAKAR
jgi:Ca2+-binding EF-hand superfamily protein